MSVCKFCQKEITWIKEGRKNVAIEGDGAVHECRQMKESMKSIKQLDRSSLSAEDIKRYEEAINQKKK